MEYVTLNNKLECPVVGIGTFMLSPADAENSVRYRYFQLRRKVYRGTSDKVGNRATVHTGRGTPVFHTERASQDS